jgi:hypothetical protein
LGPIFSSTVLPLVVLAAALPGVLFKGTAVVRRIAVGIVLFGVWAGFGPLTEPHRLAEELHGAQQSDEWGRGARDTRDVVYRTFPLLEDDSADA